MKEWTKIFKALGNDNRLGILKVIERHGELSVKMICQKLDKKVKMVSKHLGILAHMNIVEGEGKLGSVWYKLHPTLRSEVKIILHKFLK